MFDGELKKVEDIVVGDKVMGWKGPQTVIELKRGKQQMAKIIPIKGNPFVVNLDHILTVGMTPPSCNHKSNDGYKRGEIHDLSVRKYLSLKPTTRTLMKLVSSDGIDTWERKNYRFSPYFIGALLGDGGLSSKSMVTFTSQDDRMWDIISEECDKFGWKMGETNEIITWRITNCPDLFEWLRKNDLLPVACENRHVPHDYKTGSVDQRLEILAGLIDTDGYYHKGNGYSITLKSLCLANDVTFLSRSVGLSAYVKEVKKQCKNNGVWGTYFNVSISGDVNKIPCQLNYKKAHPRKQIKNIHYRGFNVELLEVDNYYGFSLDGDGRFLSDEFVIFHNTGKTYTACAVARELDFNICVVCPKAVIKTWNKVVKRHFKMGAKLIGVINYEKLIRGRKDNPLASYVLRRHEKRPTFEWKLPKKTLIIWDESHKLKNWKTKNSKTCQVCYYGGIPNAFSVGYECYEPTGNAMCGTCYKTIRRCEDVLQVGL